MTQLGPRPGSLEEMAAILGRVRCPVLVATTTTRCDPMPAGRRWPS